MRLLEAIATFEGYYVRGTRPQRNNSPGDLLYGGESIRFGAVRADGRFAVFPDPQTGWKALQHWLSVPAKFDDKCQLVAGYCGATLSQIINRFAPDSENNTQHYINTVCDFTGLTPETIITPEHLEYNA